MSSKEIYLSRRTVSVDMLMDSLVMYCNQLTVSKVINVSV